MASTPDRHKPQTQKTMMPSTASRPKDEHNADNSGSAMNEAPTQEWRKPEIRALRVLNSASVRYWQTHGANPLTRIPLAYRRRDRVEINMYAPYQAIAALNGTTESANTKLHNIDHPGLERLRHEITDAIERNVSGVSAGSQADLQLNRAWECARTGHSGRMRKRLLPHNFHTVLGALLFARSGHLGLVVGPDRRRTAPERFAAPSARYARSPPRSPPACRPRFGFGAEILLPPRSADAGAFVVGVEPTLVSPAAKFVRCRESTPAESSASRCRSVV